MGARSYPEKQTSPQTKLRMKLIAYRTLTVAWGLVISYFSLLPREMMVTTALGDKVEHFIGYCALSLLANLGWKAPRITTNACIVFGILIEVAQGFEGSRTPSIADAIANSLGAIAGFLIARYLLKRFQELN